MRNRTFVAVIALGGLLAGAPMAQAQGGNANMAMQITKTRRANAALMRQYTWNSRTEIIENGEVKDIRIELVNYGPNGQLQRSLINNQGSRMPFGFLRRAIAEARKRQLEEYLTGLRGLIEQYTLPTEGKVLDFMNQATTSGPDAAGLFQMTGNSVVVPGDTFTVWTDARTRKTRRVQVNTFFQGDMVNVTATFETIPSGLTYMAYAEATVGAKGLSVQVQNFNYSRPN
jgi:hypothetical protein